MKNYKRIIMALAALAVATSCSDYLQTGGNLVRFNAGTGEPGTKTSYSGQQTDGRERVDWTVGDVMTIYCEESPTPASHQSDYKIAGTPSSSGYYSVGSVERRVGDIGLRWADDETLVHHFYAVSPANYTNSSVSVRYNVVTQCAEYIGAVPATQAPKSVSADANGNYTAAPDMKNLIMVAQVAQTKNDSETVTLDFKPVVTAVDFTIMNGYADQSAMTLSSIRLSSSSSDLSGGFSALYDDTESTEYASAGRTVEIPFSSPASVAYGKTLKFTVFLLGDESTTAADIDNLTIELITDATTSIQADLKTTAGNMTFPRSKKSYVTGLIVPGACVWTISAEPDAVTTWGESSSSIDIGPQTTTP